MSSNDFSLLIIMLDKVFLPQHLFFIRIVMMVVEIENGADEAQ